MAVDIIQLPATQRTEFGKGAARRIRRDDKVPAVVYGHGTEPLHITLPGHETQLALRNSNALVEVTVEGGNKTLALPKQVQRDPITGFLEHVDFIIVRRDEKVVVDVTLSFVGEAEPEALVSVDRNEISVEVPVIAIPESIEVSVEGLNVGDQIKAADLKLPADTVYQGEDDDLIVAVNAAPTADQLEEELAEAEAEAGIERDEPEADNGGEASGSKGDSED
ncbi:50S ribosomal protein L25/general stress protein Ctc [Parenemella sanctibonifatiensis]|uniref:Large ribosomal subunit protein bL25 n=1 Tax=Parenemella sanctibonifatiensis TaxID=2016505 RepID=A0A255ESD4_9ACTN|nr:50S ribosomal protein L25/general stress protein Ctc [Parenemella sanctibonifatiensis]OYN92352.1 50S ribosomal protein L25/general stress protein Ctc [Parenemella sanctibonifatiensis]